MLWVQLYFDISLAKEGRATMSIPKAYRRAFAISFQLLVLTASLHGAEDNWCREFGPQYPGNAYSIAVDEQGVYVAGWVNDVALPGQAAQGWADAFLRKYDHDGREIWTRQFGTWSSDVGYGVSTDSSGVYVTGTTGDSLDGQPYLGMGDVFIQKYTHDGSLQWTHEFGSLLEDTAEDIFVYGDSIYVAGHTQGELTARPSEGEIDAFVCKFLVDGDHVDRDWCVQFGSSSSDLAGGVAADASGVFVTGSSRGGLFGHSNQGESDAFVVKFDPRGEYLWSDVFGGQQQDYMRSVAVQSNAIYVTGVAELADIGLAGSVLRSYRLDGVHEWTRSCGMSGFAWDVAAGPTGVAVSGFASLPPLSGFESLGQWDACVVMWDLHGSPYWHTQFGTALWDWAFAVAMFDGSVYSAGLADSEDLGAGLGDVFVCKHSPEWLSAALFDDRNGDTLHDPGEENARTSLGGEVGFVAEFTNLSAQALTVTPGLEGIPAEWLELPEPFVLLSGESRRDTIVVRVAEDAEAKTYPLTLRGATERGAAAATGSLEVLRVPLIYDLLPPDGIVTARQSVSVSWRTSSETTGKVHWKNLETGEMQEMKDSLGSKSREHRVELSGLKLGTLYEWWVESTGPGDGRAVAPSDPANPSLPVPRRFLVGNGVTFTQREYAAEAERDYGQPVMLGIQNNSDEMRVVVLGVVNPYPDVEVDFAKVGSPELPVVLGPGEPYDVEMSAHLQDMDPARKELLFTAEIRSVRGGTSIVVDTAVVRVRVITPDVRFTVSEVGAPKPCSLARTFRVTNQGGNLTDLKVRLSRDLAGRVAVVPSITSARLASGGTLDFQLLPVGALGDGASGELEVSAAGKKEVVAISFVPPAGVELRKTLLEDVFLCVSSADSGCLNRGRVSIPLEIPVAASREVVQSAALHLRFTPRHENAEITYRVSVSLNGRLLARLDRPVGEYGFEVPLDALRLSGEQSSVNTVTLTVSDFNAGSYYMAEEARLCLCLSEYECKAYAASDADARACCLSRPGFVAAPLGSLTGELTLSPDPVTEGEKATIRAVVRSGAVAAEGLVVTARISGREAPIGLREASPGIYEGAWRPGCAGEVTLDLHVAACPGGVIATRVVPVGAGAEKLLSAPYYDAPGTAWDWAGALSGLLHYHGLRVKPWTIAAALGADPSQGLDLRESAGDLREPSLAGLLDYLKNHLGLRLVRKRYGSSDAGSLPCDLRAALQQDHPVWLAHGDGSTGESAALLVVGASADGVRVHEMSGAEGSPRLNVEVSSAELAARLFPSAESLAVTLEVISVPPKSGGLSLSLPPLLPGQGSGGLQIVHSPGVEELKLLWVGEADVDQDGELERLPLGYVFSDPLNDPGSPETWRTPANVFPPDPTTGWAPLLGDKLELGVEVANAGSQAADVQVEVELKHLRSGWRVARASAVESVAVGDWNHAVVVLSPESPLVLEPQGNCELTARLLQDGAVVESLVVPLRVRCPWDVPFVRGDVGKRRLGASPVPADRTVNMTDAIAILSYLFLDNGQTVLDCEKAADTNDDGSINITDPVYLLNFLFLGGPRPPAPYPDLGLDLTSEDDDLDCCQSPEQAP